MTTWTEVDDQSTTYSLPGDSENGYVLFGYLENDYILGSLVWDTVDAVSTTWTEA
jgi:hypothetical protein